MKNAFKNLIDKLFNKEIKQKICVKSIREFLPKDFLEKALNNIIYYKGAFGKKIENISVVNSYFIGATLCLDIKLDYPQRPFQQDVITINCEEDEKDEKFRIKGTFGLFTNSNMFERSELNNTEISLYNYIKENLRRK